MGALLGVRILNEWGQWAPIICYFITSCGRGGAGAPPRPQLPVASCQFIRCDVPRCGIVHTLKKYIKKRVHSVHGTRDIISSLLLLLSPVVRDYNKLVSPWVIK